MPVTLDDLRRAGLVEQLAACYWAPVEAQALLLLAGVSTSQIPPMMGPPIAWWTDVCHRLLNGAGDIGQVCARAREQYPSNPIFVRLASPTRTSVETSRPPATPQRWLHAHLLDRVMQWRTLEEVVQLGRSTLILLHGRREQALFQFIRRVRTELPLSTLQVLEVPFRRHGQDRGPLSAELWIRDVRRSISETFRTPDVQSLRRAHPVMVAIEALYPHRRSEEVLLRDLALGHLPRLCAEQAEHPLVIVLIIERDTEDDGFARRLGDDLRRVVQEVGVAYRQVHVAFPGWDEVEVFLDRHDCPGTVHSWVQEQYEEIRDAGGDFVLLANLIEEALDEMQSTRR